MKKNVWDEAADWLAALQGIEPPAPIRAAIDNGNQISRLNAAEDTRQPEVDAAIERLLLDRRISGDAQLRLFVQRRVHFALRMCWILRDAPTPFDRSDSLLPWLLLPKYKEARKLGLVAPPVLPIDVTG